jgi:hypothetical protein
MSGFLGQRTNEMNKVVRGYGKDENKEFLA